MAPLEILLLVFTIIVGTIIWVFCGPLFGILTILTGLHIVTMLAVWRLISYMLGLLKELSAEFRAINTRLGV